MRRGIRKHMKRILCLVTALNLCAGDWGIGAAGRDGIKAQFPHRLSSEQGVCLRKSGYSVEWMPREGGSKACCIEDNRIRYVGVLDGIDCQYTVMEDVVKEDVILLRPGEQGSFSYKIKADGMKIWQEENVIYLQPKEGEIPLFLMEAPYMEDAAGICSWDLKLRIQGGEGEKGETTVILEADTQWLSSPDRVYPVRIDPTVSAVSPVLPLSGLYLGLKNLLRSPAAGFSFLRDAVNFLCKKM